MGLLLIILLFMYFLPSIVAVVQGKKNKGAVIVLNLFLGWSVIGWVVALVWAVAHEGEQKITIQNTTNTNTADELTKLAALKTSGVITDAEFEAKKKQILGL